ncbi:MAG: oligosaccharide flippase family protein [Sphingobium sp.]
MPGAIRGLAGRAMAARHDFRFFSNFGILVFGQLASRVMGFVAFAWLARRLDPVSYGAVEYVVGLSVFFAMVVDGGLNVLGTRRVAADPAKRNLLAFQIPVGRLGIAIIGIPVMAGMAILSMKQSVPVALVWLFALSLLSAPWRQQWLFQSSDRMSVVSVSEILRMTIFCLIVLALVRSDADILIVGWAEIAAIAGMTLYMLVQQRRHFSGGAIANRFEGFGGLLKEGAAVSSTNLVWAFNQYVPLFMVTALIGGVAVAWFAGASRIVVSVLQFSNLYHFNLYPSVTRAYAHGEAEMRQLMNRSMRVVGWGGIGVATALAVLAKPAVSLTLGPKLADAAPLLAVMAWMIPITLASGHARWGLTAAGQQVRVLTAQIAGVIVTVTTILAASHFLGVMGYAIGTIAGFLAVWATAHVFARRYRCCPPSILVVAPALLSAAVVIALADWFDAGLGLSFGLLVAMAATAPLVDRRLIGDAIALGRSKIHMMHDNSPSSAKE